MGVEWKTTESNGPAKETDWHQHLHLKILPLLHERTRNQSIIRLFEIIPGHLQLSCYPEFYSGWQFNWSHSSFHFKLVSGMNLKLIEFAGNELEACDPTCDSDVRQDWLCQGVSTTSQTPHGIRFITRQIRFINLWVLWLWNRARNWAGRLITVSLPRRCFLP